MRLAESGSQVFIGSHSLFLLRELHILQQMEFPQSGYALFVGAQVTDRRLPWKCYRGEGPWTRIGDVAVLDEEVEAVGTG